MRPSGPGIHEVSADALWSVCRHLMALDKAIWTLPVIPFPFMQNTVCTMLTNNGGNLLKFLSPCMAGRLHFLLASQGMSKCTTTASRSVSTTFHLEELYSYLKQCTKQHAHPLLPTTCAEDACSTNHYEWELLSCNACSKIIPTYWYTALCNAIIIIL